MLCYTRKNGKVRIKLISKKRADYLYYTGKIDEWQKIYILEVIKHGITNL